MRYKVVLVDHEDDGHDHEALIGRYKSSKEASERGDQELRRLGYNGEIRIIQEKEVETNEG